MDQIVLIREGFPETPGLDVAANHALLGAVSRGESPPALRIHVPGAVVAFGRADSVLPGYPYAVRAALAHGFAPVERLAGGRAAVFHERTIAFSWATPDPEPKAGITQRFEKISGLVLEALEALGVDARIGQVPGEYCPGAWSVNVGGRVKVMGVGQRLVRGGAHVGGVIVVDDGHRVRDVLVPVYRELGLDWDPRTAGAVTDRSPGLTTGEVADALIHAFSKRYDLTPGRLTPEVIAEAGSLIDDHLPRVA